MKSTKKQGGAAANAALAAGYLGLGLLWVWRLIHPSAAKAPSRTKPTWAAKTAGKLSAWARQLEDVTGATGAADPDGSEAKDAADKDTEEAAAAALPSLSLTTPGYAALDRVAQYAAAEAAAGLSEEPLPPFERKPRAWQANSPLVLEVLAHQRLESPRLEGWNEPRPGKLPLPTFAPAIMAFGIIMFAMGLATIWYVCLVGSLIFVIAAWRWTAELQEV